MPTMRLGWIKFHYVLVYAILGSLLPYLSIYATQRGLTGSEIGWVFGVFGVAVMIAPPIYTALADRFAANRSLIAGCYGLGAAALVGLGFAESFPAILLMHLLFALVFASLIPLMDGLTFATTQGPADESPGFDLGKPRTPYRKVRIFGSYGWMAPGAIFPLLLLADVDALAVSRAAMATGAVFGVVGLVSCAALPRYRAATARSALPTADALRALLQRDVRVFVAVVFMLFMSIAVLFTFYPPYLKALGVRSELVGLITNLGVAVEIVCMIGSGWLIGRVGLRGVMLFGVGCHVARMVLLAAWPTATVGIVTQLFHGPTVLALYLIPPMYLNAHAAGRFRNSIQGLYAMLCFGVARVIGSALAGYVQEHVGETALAGYTAAFWTAAGLGAVSIVLLIVRFREPRSIATMQ